MISGAQYQEQSVALDGIPDGSALHESRISIAGVLCQKLH